MLFGVVSGVGQGTGASDGGGNRPRGRGNLGVTTVTNGDFVA